MTTKQHVNFSDSARTIKDKISMGAPGINDQNKLTGRVKVHARDINKNDGSKGKIYLVQDTNNLIIYRGRNWLLQRAFNKDMSSRPNWKDKWITWFAVGTGGAEAGMPLVPSSPSLENCGLDTHGTITAGDRWVTAGGLDYHQFDTGYPIFINDPEIIESNPRGSATPAGSVDLCNEHTEIDPIDSDTYPSDKFLIALTRTTITAEECNGGTEPTDYQDINEAGLFISPSELRTYNQPTGFSADDMNIFARVCFSTIRKDVNRELIFSWYIYF